MAEPKTQDERLGTLEGLVGSLTSAVERLTDKVDKLGQPQYTLIIALAALILSFGGLVYSNMADTDERIEARISDNDDVLDGIIGSRFTKDDYRYEREQKRIVEDREQALRDEIRHLESEKQDAITEALEKRIVKLEGILIKDALDENIF